ncbi:hypothetical protein Esti_005815 [Eimeria stiedai]
MMKEKKSLRMAELFLKLVFLWAPSCALPSASTAASKPSNSISARSRLSGQQRSEKFEWSFGQRPGGGVSFPLQQKSPEQSSTWEWSDESDASEKVGSPGVFAEVKASFSGSKEDGEKGGETSEGDPNSNAQQEPGAADAAGVAAEGAESSTKDAVSSPPSSPYEMVKFEWDLSVPGEQNNGPPPVSDASQTTKQLMESLKLDLQEKLTLHHSSKGIYADAQRSGTMTDLPQAVTGKLCNKVLVRVVKEPSVTATVFSSVMARLGTAFNRVKAAGKIIMSKLMRLFKGDANGGAESKAVQWVKKMARAAWVKMRGILKSILTVVVRFLPMILFIVNIVVLGISVSSLVAAPNPISLLGIMSTICRLVSFIFSTSIQLHTKKVVEQALSQKSEIGDLQLFGLSWASLRAEEDLQRIAIHKSEFGELEELIDLDAQEREQVQKRAAGGRPSSFGRSAAAGSETATTQASSGEEKGGEKPPLERKNSKRSSFKGLTPEELERRTKEARRRMLQRIRVDRVKQSFEKAKGKFKQARKAEAKPAKKMWNMAKNSVRLLAESLNFGLHRVLERFGSAWEWAINVGLRKIIRFFQMLTLYIIIAAWFERFVAILKWLAGQGKFYLNIFDTLRGSATFLIVNADKISALVKGTIQVSASLVDYTVFVALLLNALTKPIYGLYFALQGMKADTTRSMAMKEFESNRKAFTNFLLGSAAVEGDIGQAGAFNVPGSDLLEIMFVSPLVEPLNLPVVVTRLMTYLEQYKAHTMESHELRDMNPLQAYTFHERTVRFDQLLSKMQPAERAKFQNVFTSLKNWKIDETASAARDHLLSSVQHCILLASIGELTRRISDRTMLQLRITGMEKGSAKRIAQSFSKKMTHLLTHSPSSITNPANLYREVRQALRSSWGVLLRHDDVVKLQRFVYEIALDVFARETVVEVPGDGGSVVDTTAVHVNLLPFRMSLSLYELYHSLQKLFTISMTAGEQNESARSAPLGPIPNTKTCKPIRPSIGLFPESDKAVVQFGEGECGKIAANSFLRTQIEPEVRQLIREEVFEVNPDECAPFATETYTAIDIAVEQILLSDIPQSALKDAIEHATNELTDRYQFALEAKRALAHSNPSVKVDSVRTLRLLQAVAMIAEEQSIFNSLIVTAFVRLFGVAAQLTPRIFEMVGQMYTEYICEACMTRHMLQLVLSVGITTAEENRQFLFRLLARVYATAIVEHVKTSMSVKERVLHNYTYWHEHKLFTKGEETAGFLVVIFDQKEDEWFETHDEEAPCECVLSQACAHLTRPPWLSLSSSAACANAVKFFYYYDDAKLVEILGVLFDDSLEGLGEALRNSRESAPSSSQVVLRIHHFVSRKVAYAAEIATAQGNPPPPPLEEREVYNQLLEAYEDVSAEVKELKPLIIKVLKSGQYYPGGYLCMDNSNPAMWVFSTGIASNVTEVLHAVQKRWRRKAFHTPEDHQQVVSQLLLDVLSALENIHKHSVEGTHYVLDMRYRFLTKEKSESSETLEPSDNGAELVQEGTPPSVPEEAAH